MADSYNEGLVLPPAATPVEEPDLVLPPNLGIPAPEPYPERIRTRVNPEGKAPRSGMTFEENRAGFFRSNTPEGAIIAAGELNLARGDPAGAGIGAPAFDGEGNPISPEDRAAMDRIAQERAMQSVYDQLAYELAPTNISPASIAGSLVGGIQAPSNLLGFGGTLAKTFGGLAARPVLRTAVDVGLVSGASDVATQGIRVGSGAQEDFDPYEAAMATVLGAGAGAGIHVAGEGAKKGVRYVFNRLRDRFSRAAAATDRGLAGAQEAPQTATAEIPQPDTVQLQLAAGESPRAPSEPISISADDAKPLGDVIRETEAQPSAVAEPSTKAVPDDKSGPINFRIAEGEARYVERGGRRFVAREDGATELGEITPEIGAAIGREAAPIRLPEGDETFGEIHIASRGRGEALRAAGYDDPAVFVSEVVSGFNEVREARSYRLLLVKRNGPAKTAFVELQPDESGAHWTVTTAGFRRPNDASLKGRLLWEGGRSPTQLDPGGTGPDPLVGARGQSGENVSSPAAVGNLIGMPLADTPLQRIAVAGGSSIEARPIVVEARALKASSDAGYDPALQPRDRDRAASQAQIRDITANLDPDRLGFSSEADRGAPIVGPDGMVESGNGRLMAIRQAYEEGGEAAQRYRAWLDEQGIDTGAFEQPVIVRQRLTELSLEERVAFADAANRSSTLAMSAPERALADARLITPESLDLIRIADDLAALGNRDFVRAFVRRLPQSEQGALMTPEGGLSAEGLARVRNAVLAKAYDDPAVLARVAEATSDDVKSISNALVSAAPEWAKMRADVASGRVRADVDLTPELVEAVSRTADLRAKGVKLSDHLAQQDAFDRMSAPVEAWMRMFYAPQGRRAAGGPLIADRLKFYAQEARKITGEAGLDLGLPAIRPEDIQALAAKRGVEDAGSQDVLFRRRPGDGPSSAEGRGDLEGQFPGGGREGTGGARAGGDQGASIGGRQAQLIGQEQVKVDAKEIAQELFRGRRDLIPTPHENQVVKSRPVVDQGSLVQEADTRPGRLEDLARGFVERFESVMRTGRVKAGAAGTYNLRSGVIRVRSVADLDTVVHEVGHKFHLDPSSRPAVQPIITRNRAELAPMGALQGEVGEAEAFAELFRLYVTNRAFAERTYPSATADLDGVLRARFPDQARALDEMRAGLDVIHRADSGALVSADVVTPKPDNLLVRILDHIGLKDSWGIDFDPKGRPVYKWSDALFTRYIDKLNPIAKAVEGLGRIYKDNTGKTLDLLPVDDAYILARLSSGAHAAADQMLKRGVRPAGAVEYEGASFWDAVHTAIGKRWTQEAWHEFGAYLVARRMVAEYARFLKGEIPNPPGKFSLGDYEKAVAEIGSANPTFAPAAAQLYQFQQNLLRRHFDKHLFTRDYFDAASSRVDYVPLHRDLSDLGQGVTVNMRGGDFRESLMQSFRGSQRSPLNPLDTIFKKVHDLEFTVAANDTKRALAELADLAGPGGGAIAERIPSTQVKSIKVDVLEALREAGARTNMDSSDLGALVQHAEMLLGDDAFARIFRKEPIHAGAEPITFYFENGERRALRLMDGRFGAELHAALNGMSETQRNVFISLLKVSATTLRVAVTKSLGFTYRNLVRDQLTSAATAGRGYIPFVTAFRGGLDVLFGGGDFERYVGFGGISGGAINQAIEDSAFGKSAQSFREKGPLDPRRWLETAGKFIELSEASTRAGLFQSYAKQAKALGLDDLNATLYSTFKANDYIDFRRSGSHMAMVRSLVPFLNASLQGTERETRALVSDMVRLESKRLKGEDLTTLERDRLKDARAAWIKTLAVGMVFGGGSAYLNAENPEWSKQADWRRHGLYSLFPVGDGRWFVVPKPFGIVRDISNLFEYATEYAIRRDPALVGKWFAATIEAHALPYTNPIIDVFYNVRSNYDAFRDRPIIPRSLEDRAPNEQYTRFTSELAKWIAKANPSWSPMKVDYVIKSLGGSMAQDFLASSDNLLKQTGREKTVWDLPLLREMAKNLRIGDQATTEFYNIVGRHAGRLEQASAGYKGKIDAGERQGAEAYLRNMKDDERSWTTLMQMGFGIESKLMHPLYAARTYTTVISGVSRALNDQNLVREKDLERGNRTLSRRDAQPIAVDGPTREKLLSEFDALSKVLTRNALITTKAPGMNGVAYADPQAQLSRIKALSPEVFREYQYRVASQSPYDLDTVRERWPEVQRRLLKDGKDADLTDLTPRRIKPKAARRAAEMAE